RRHRLFPPRVGRVPEGRDRMRLRAQALEVVHEPVARVLGVLVVNAHVDRLLGADFLAIPAEDAAELVDLVDQRAAVALLVLSRHPLDAVRRADLGAPPAGDALGPPLLVGEHAVRAAPPRRDRPVRGAFLLGVLHRHLGPKQMPQRERHPLEGGAHVGGPTAGPPHHLHPDRHQAPPPASATAPATSRPRSSTNTSGTPSSTLTPHSVSAKRVSYDQPSRSCSTQIAVASTVREVSASGSITF